MIDPSRREAGWQRRRWSRARSVAGKFPNVPLAAWPRERRVTLVLRIALLWSAAMLLGGALGAGLIG